jgi:hypothetical protein
MHSRVMSESGSIPAEARLLGYGAAVPFVVAAAAMWLASSGDAVGAFLTLLLTYGAVGLSFLGGVRCGLALPAYRGSARARRIALAVMPPAVGWLALLPGPLLGLGLLICGYMIQCLWDVLSAEAGRLPPWYADLRVQFTAIAVGCLIAGLARIVTG